MPFQIIRNDITKVKADAIVNTANPDPEVGGGTDTAIYEAAGWDDLLEERKKIGPIEPGHTEYTPAFRLDAKYDLSRTCDEIRPEYIHVESCQETVPEAVTAFLEGEDFEDVIRTAVSLGGDCDTLTCIAGSMAEAYKDR